jgi:hypothetical protein
MLHWIMDLWFEVIFAKGLKGIVSLTVSCYLVKEMGLVPEMWLMCNPINWQESHMFQNSVLNYARSSGTDPHIKCDHTVY